ncbi:hypothetical protein GC093_20575 [Paenibacillus sp. LMG 31456]|uniref:Uncharacterized protein n=1 Tax=Paenibacillus foliorum TaxID=2654974 RepID=A0A972GRN2_9BACL|nr:hypothetical protein [Paenibacillus foliorum]NOU95606.1 hypothetical protein [Paenibacillus foliorum]
MTLSKKGSRKIIVNDEEFRWIISPSKDFISLIAEHGHEKGRRIEVYIKSDINRLWVEFPHIDDQNLKVITPKDTSFIISEAIKQGWNPKEKGKPMVFDLNGDSLVKR